MTDRSNKSIGTIENIEKIYDLDVNSNEKIIAVAGINNVKLWAMDGDLLAKLPVLNLNSDISSNGYVKFSSDGKMLLLKQYGYSNSGSKPEFISEKDTIMVWEFNIKDLTKKGCDWLNSYLKSNPTIDLENNRVCILNKPYN
jgi:hypothetical protein